MLPASNTGEWAIADERMRSMESKQLEGKGECRESLPLCLRGGGDSNDEETVQPFTGFKDPTEKDICFIEETIREMNNEFIGKNLYNFIEDYMQS